MKTVANLLTSLLLVILSAFPLKAASGSDDNKKDLLLAGYYRDLAQATDPRDSVEIIFDMFDLLPAARRPQMGAILYDLSQRYSEGADELDVLRMLALIYKDNPYALQQILKEVERKPKSDEQEETILYINIFQFNQQAERSEGKTYIKDELAKLLSPEKEEPRSENPYENLRRLFKICMYTKAVTEGSMLTEQLVKIDNELKHLTASTWGIRRQFADMKQRIYTDNDNPEAAVEASREILDILEGMKSVYLRQERKHMKLYWFRYRAYCSILRNYRADNVTADDVETVYAALNHLADSIPEVRAAYEEYNYPDIYYHMARGEYAKAMPLIRNALETENELMQKRFISRLMLRAARELNSPALRLEADMIYIPLLKEYIQRKDNESLNEMEIFHKVSEIRAKSIEDEIAMRRQLSRKRQTVIATVIAAAVVLIGAISVLAVLSFRLLRARRRLRRTNRVLTARRNELQKGRDELINAVAKSKKAEQSKETFIKYISSTISLPLASIMEYSDKVIEGSDETHRRFLKKFSDVMHDNSRQLKDIALKLQQLSRGDKFITTRTK